MTDFVFLSDSSSDDPQATFNRRLTEPTTSSVSPLMQNESPSRQYNRRRLSYIHNTSVNAQGEQINSPIILSVGRDGQCLLQDFSLGM